MIDQRLLETSPLEKMVRREARRCERQVNADVAGANNNEPARELRSELHRRRRSESERRASMLLFLAAPTQVLVLAMQRSE